MPLLRSSTGALFNGTDEPQAARTAAATLQSVQEISRLAERNEFCMVCLFRRAEMSYRADKWDTLTRQASPDFRGTK